MASSTNQRWSFVSGGASVDFTKPTVPACSKTQNPTSVNNNKNNNNTPPRAVVRPVVPPRQKNAQKNNVLETGKVDHKP